MIFKVSIMVTDCGNFRYFNGDGKIEIKQSKKEIGERIISFRGTIKRR